jgi:hypothetical protein
MLEKKLVRKIAFGEADESFVKQLAHDIGCYYNKANERTYSLNRFKSLVGSEMGVFAWVHKEENDLFWVATRKIWIQEAKAKAMASRKKSQAECFPRDNMRADDSIFFDTKDGYDKTVSSLRLLNKMR